MVTIDRYRILALFGMLFVGTHTDAMLRVLPPIGIALNKLNFSQLTPLVDKKNPFAISDFEAFKKGQKSFMPCSDHEKIVNNMSSTYSQEIENREKAMKNLKNELGEKVNRLNTEKESLQKRLTQQEQQNNQNRWWWQRYWFFEKCAAFTAFIAAMIWTHETEKGANTYRKTKDVVTWPHDVVAAKILKRQLLAIIRSKNENKLQELKKLFPDEKLDALKRLYPYLDGATIIYTLVQNNFFDGFKFLLETGAIIGINFTRGYTAPINCANGNTAVLAKYAPLDYNPFLYVSNAQEQWVQAILDQCKKREVSARNTKNRPALNFTATELLNRPINGSAQTVLDYLLKKSPHATNLIGLLKAAGAKTFEEMHAEAEKFAGKKFDKDAETITIYNHYLAQTKSLLVKTLPNTVKLHTVQSTINAAGGKPQEGNDQEQSKKGDTPVQEWQNKNKPEQISKQ